MRDLVTFVVIGLAAGSLYGVAAAGLVITYRTSGVFNFAHGAIAAVGAYTFYDLRTRLPLPAPVIFVLVVAGAGAVLGLLLEAGTRALVGAQVHLRVVASVGLLLAIEGGTTAWFGTDARFVAPLLPRGSVTIAGVHVGYDALLTIAGGGVALACVHAFLTRSRAGLEMRAVVEDEALLAATGVSPHRVRRAGWIVGSAVAVASGILLAPSIGLEPLLLAMLVVQAFGAAAVGRFASIPLTYAGGLTIGVITALASRYLHGVHALEGFPSAAPFIVLFVVLIVAPPGALAGADVGGSRRLVSRRLPARARLAAWCVTPTALVFVPALTGPRLPVFVNAAALSIVLLSLAVLVNLAGQISLCHAGFCAIGATAFAHAAAHGVPWPVALVLAGFATVPLAVAIAVPAARLSTLSLALATFGLGVLLQHVVYGTGLMFGAGGVRTVARPGVRALATDTGYFFVVVAVAAAAGALVVAVQRGAWGRLVIAIADSPTAVSACGGSVLAARVAVFAGASFLAGVGGALVAGATESVSSTTFPPLLSLTWLAVLTIGGRGLAVTAVRAALAAAVIPAYFVNLIGNYQLLLFGGLAMVMALVRSRPQRAVVA